MGWVDELQTRIPKSFLIKLFEKVFNLRFTDKVKFTEIIGGYAFFDISIPVNSRYSITERIQLKAFAIKGIEYANIELPEIKGDVGISTQGNIFYRFTEDSKGAIQRCLPYKRY
jgi:hypothetical protein